jgi:hypothetical protein
MVPSLLPSKPEFPKGDPESAVGPKIPGEGTQNPELGPYLRCGLLGGRMASSVECQVGVGAGTFGELMGGAAASVYCFLILTEDWFSGFPAFVAFDAEVGGIAEGAAEGPMAAATRRDGRDGGVWFGAEFEPVASAVEEWRGGCEGVAVARCSNNLACAWARLNADGVDHFPNSAGTGFRCRDRWTRLGLRVHCIPPVRPRKPDCQSRHLAPQQNRPLLDHLVGAASSVGTAHALATS